MQEKNNRNICGCGLVDVMHKSLISIVVQLDCNLLVLVRRYPIHPTPSQHSWIWVD
jgi:hypothetical protein